MHNFFGRVFPTEHVQPSSRIKRDRSRGIWRHLESSFSPSIMITPGHLVQTLVLPMSEMPMKPLRFS